MADIKSEFSWSKSRDDIFNTCKRAYYLQYYGSWGGWKEDSPSREAYILKNLISRQIWIGQIVHETIKSILLQYKAGINISLSQAIQRLKKRLDNDFSVSNAKLYRQHPKYKVGLFEHEYNLLITKDEWEDVFKNAEECVRNFYNSDLFRYIKSINKNDWIFLEDFLTFSFEGTKVYLSIDFAIKEKDRIVLFDWKTGQQRDIEDIKTQLYCYALYVLQKWNLPANKIGVKIYNARIDKEDTFEITPNIIDETKNYIKDSISNMQAILTDTKVNQAEESNFPKTEDRRKCNYCNFKKICFSQGDSVFTGDI